MRIPVGGLVLLCGAVVLHSCASPVYPDAMARGQRPGAAAAAVTWTATGARMIADLPFRRLSCRLVIKVETEKVRLVVLADEGPVLMDAEAGANGPVVHHAIAELAETAPRLASAAWATWGTRPEHWVWDGERCSASVGSTVLRYAGDPLLLRRIEGLGPDIEVGDYRRAADTLIAQQLRVRGMGYRLEIRLGDF